MDHLIQRARRQALEIKADAERWCGEDRFWPPRAVLLLWLAYMLVRLLQSPSYSPLIGSLNFGIHELGHYVFSPFGSFMRILGGSLFQCLAPVLAFFMFLKQRDYFGVAFTFGWLSTNLFAVAVYCADARTMQLILLSPGGGEAYHDWNYILDDLNLLPHDHQIAFLMRALGVVTMLIALASGGWIVWRMIDQRSRATRKPT